MSNPRGFALIINNLEFASDPNITRAGAEQDSDNLRTILGNLHFQVTVRHNVQKTALLREDGIIDKFLCQFEATDVDCCIVAVMSHGTEGYFLTSDPERIQDPNANRVSLSREFLPRFNNHFPRFSTSRRSSLSKHVAGKCGIAAFSERSSTPRILKNRIPVAVKVAQV